MQKRARDIDKINELEEDKERVNGSWKKESLQAEIDKIWAEYPEGLAYEDMVKNYFRLYDIRGISSDLTTYATKYSDWVDSIYTVFLNNAVRMHRLEDLNKFYPTTEQKNKFRKIVEEKILDKVRAAHGKAILLSQRADEFQRTADNIIELTKKTSDGELLKKGAISLGLAFISGPLGILNGIREAYNMSEADNKATELRDKLCNSFDNEFWQEQNSLLNVLGDACLSIMESMEDEIAVNYLAPALNNIVATLQANNVKMAPLNEYFKN